MSRQQTEDKMDELLDLLFKKLEEKIAEHMTFWPEHPTTGGTVGDGLAIARDIYREELKGVIRMSTWIKED